MLLGSDLPLFFALLDGMWGPHQSSAGEETGGAVEEPEEPTEPAPKRVRVEPPAAVASTSRAGAAFIPAPSAPLPTSSDLHPDFRAPTLSTIHLVVEGEEIRSAGIPPRWQPTYEKRDAKGGRYYCSICSHNTGNRESSFTHTRRHLLVQLGCPHCPGYGVASVDAWEKHMRLLHPLGPHRVPAESMAQEVPPAVAVKVEDIVKRVHREQQPPQ